MSDNDAPTPAAIPVMPFYSDKDIDAIIKAVGRFPSETMLYVRPDYLYLAADGGYGPAAISLCETLVSTLCNQRGSLFGGLILGGTEEPECPNVQQIIADVSQLQGWLAWRATHIGRLLKKSGHGGSRRKSLASFNMWVRHLADIYHYVFDLDPAFSVDVDTQDTGGPFARYLDLCIRPILGDATPTPQALRSRFRRLQKDGHFKLQKNSIAAILTLEDFICIFPRTPHPAATDTR